MATASDELVTLQQGETVLLKGFDYLEFYVGNAFQAAHFYRNLYGFKPVAFSGLETGVRDRASIVLEQNDIRLVLTTALTPDHPITRHVSLHGDDVRDIAFTVSDAEAAYKTAIKNGAHSILPPTEFQDQRGSMLKATVAALGETVHSFIQRDSHFGGAFFPDFEYIENPPPVTPTGLTSIDHIAISVEAHTLNRMVDFYHEVLGFHESFSEDILTEYSSMNSKVVENASGAIKFPMVEPAPGRRKSQIEEYLNFHFGPGAQHVAFASDDIISSVRALRANGNEFLRTPESYYTVLKDRVGDFDEDAEALRDLNILVDRDEWGYLMQIFTKPVMTRPTIFTEVIQRKEARGFGAGNIKALFEAIERDQARRGNL
ncbi:MAG TPA: 4-hydroxyphenylpyruvate dioxygenase [Pyrinomonadaceae bacterium]|nr:4-hydroxyphenylpyruvate dioxygenase [Pyrinomonadaceae bacterium]